MAIERPPLLPPVLNRPLGKLRFAYRRATASRRAMPDALILGAAKAGTTSLFRYLESHPQVRVGTRKEVHFFDFHYQDGPAWYRAHFPYRRHIRPDERLIEGTPYYLVHPVAPERVAKTIPDARLLVLLRDPIERAWSHYNAWHRRGRDPRSFHDAVVQELNALDQGDSWTNMVRRRLEGRAADGEGKNRPQAYVERSLYGQQLQRWRAFFPSEALWVEESRRLFEDPAETVASACNHMGLPPPEDQSHPAHNPGRYKGRSHPEARTIDLLRDRFAEDARSIEAATGRRPSWAQ